MALTTEKTLPTLDAIKNGAGKDHFIIGDLSSVLDRLATMGPAATKNANNRGKGSWAGGLGTLANAVAKCRTGDMSLVARSDALLNRFEHLAPATRKVRSVMAVAGGFPVIPAYLAGQPLAMRRRERVLDEQGPLAVVVDVTSSAGITQDQLQIRGAACLALVRLLSATRPVQLYVGCSIATASDRYRVCHTYAHINTTPLDLARAAYVLTSQSYARQMLYSVPQDIFRDDDDDTTQWPYGMGGTAMKKNAYAILSRAIPCETMLFVPGAFLEDANIQQPEAWLEDQLKTYGALTAAAA